MTQTPTRPATSSQVRNAHTRAARESRLPARTLDWGGSASTVITWMLVIFGVSGLLGFALSLAL